MNQARWANPSCRQARLTGLGSGSVCGKKTIRTFELSEVLVHLTDHSRALPDRGGDAFDRSAANITGRKDATQTRGSTGDWVGTCFAAGHDESPFVALHRGRQPVRLWLRPD
jgi:hypothetical protein